MRYLPYILGLATLQPACASTRSEVAAYVADPNNHVVETAQSLTAAVFTAEQPALNAAVSVLPAETQALAQAAYAALQKAIDAALSEGVSAISSMDKAATSKVVVALGAASDTIHDAIHTAAEVAAVPTGSVPDTLVLPVAAGVAAPADPNG